MIFEFFKRLQIEENDLRFFFPLGFVSGIMMEITSTLPIRVYRGLFSDIIYDHLPWSTIGSLFIIQALCVFIYHWLPSKKQKVYVSDMAIHFANKIKQFCSPAFSILLGISLATTILAVFKFNFSYLKYSFVFVYASFFFIFIPFLSSVFKNCLDEETSKTYKEMYAIAGVVIFAFILIYPLFNADPIEVTFKLDVGDYKTVENAAISTDSTVVEFTKSAVLLKATKINSKERLTNR